MMIYFTKNKILFWCVVVLIVLNTVTIGSFWLKRPSMGALGGRRSPGGQQVMVERLGLSDPQVLQLEQARATHFELTIPLQDEMHQLRLALLDEVFASDPDEEKIQTMLTTLEQQSGQFEGYLVKHFQELKEMCSSQQAETLKLMFVDLIERSRPRDPRQGGARPRRKYEDRSK